MIDNLEVAKLATQLTIALMEDRNGQMTKVVYAARQAGASKDAPEVLVTYDALLKHVQASLGVQ